MTTPNGRLGPAHLAFAALLSLCLFPASSGRAEQPEASASAATTPATRLILLGTGGGPLIRTERSRPANILVVDGSHYVVDFGVGSLRRLAEAGFSAEDVDTVFFTHHHLDHNGGLADLINYSSLGQRARPVDIIGPRGTGALVDAAIRYIETPRRIFDSEGLVSSPDPRKTFLARDVESPGVIYKDGKVTVTAAENSHYQTMPLGAPSHGHDRSFAYRFETPDGVFVFSGDTGPSEELEKLAAGADYLVAEVIDVDATMQFAAGLGFPKERLQRIEEHMVLEHLTPEVLGQMASRAGVKAVVLTHYSPGLDNEDVETQYVNGVRRFYSGPVIAGRDLLEIPLTGGIAAASSN